MDISARVVVDESQHGGIVQDGLFNHHPHIHAHLCQTTLAALPSRWKMLVIHEGQEAHGKADCEDLAESPPSLDNLSTKERHLVTSMAMARLLQEVE